jgi:chemotaxis protein MotB
MARKKKHAEHVNHERWLVSYADFITLLFAFFVVMFAVSQVDSKKVGRFSESFSKAVGIEVFPYNGHQLLPAGATEVPVESGGGDRPLPDPLADIKASLLRRSKGEGALAALRVLRRRNELILRLPDGVLFASGDDRVKEPARAVLRSVVEELRGRNVLLRVEGHTDDVPIATARFRSNWELSTARATSVIGEIAKLDVLPPANLSASGYGEFHPIASNETAEGRAQNRRVDLVVALAGPASEEVELEADPGSAEASGAGADASAAAAAQGPDATGVAP